MTTPRRNWAGNVTFRASDFQRPTSIAELQRVVSDNSSVRAVGSGHSFNRIADTTGTLVTVAGLPQIIDIDSDRSQVTVSAGTRYGELGQQLQPAGFALTNTGSLPHIAVAGATSTGTHGSGNGNRNLSTMVTALQLVTADGDLVDLSREEHGEQFHGMVLALGSLGIITQLTLDIVPTFDITQDVYDDLPHEQLGPHLAELMAGGYSVSIFSDWTTPRRHQIWRKRQHQPAIPAEPIESWYGALPATAARHPLAGMPTEHSTAQLGVPGPWNERLPHFKLDFQPSSGDELQSEYLLPVQHAVAALDALNDIADDIAAVLLVSELRTVGGDDLWLSPSYHTDTFCIHFTWKPDEAGVSPVLTAIEERLAPFGVRPHWGKLFNTDPAVLATRYERWSDFIGLLNTYDPAGKFRNDMTNRLFFSAAV